VNFFLNILIVTILTLPNFTTERKFESEISIGKFQKVKYNLIPESIKEIYGCKLENQIGNKISQTGCTSGKRILVNWLVKNEFNIWFASVNNCGDWTSNKYFIVKDQIATEIDMDGKFNSFQAYKRAYLAK
jgi:hypothetical protein